MNTLQSKKEEKVTKNKIISTLACTQLLYPPKDT